jgi:hypothetical protein
MARALVRLSSSCLVLHSHFAGAEPKAGLVGRAVCICRASPRAAELRAVQSHDEWVPSENRKAAVQSAIGHTSSLSPVSPLKRHYDELLWGAKLLEYGNDRCWSGPAALPSGSGGACGDACRSTRDNRNPSTAGAPTSLCCSAGTASACRNFGCSGNHHIWSRDRSTGRAAMRGGCGRRSDQSVTRSAVRSGRTPARTSSS